MDDLIARLTAAIEETEKAARDASGRGEKWFIAAQPESGWWKDPHDDEIVADGKPIIRLNEEYGGNLAADHIVRHDPFGVLRGCAADQRVLARHKRDRDWRCETCVEHTYDPRFAFERALWPCEEIKDLAARYGLEVQGG